LEELDSDTDALQSTARKHLCQLNWQQADGLVTALPLGLRRIDALRTLTTEALAVLMPFKAQEIRDQGGVYYGQNTISKNLINGNRKELLNAMVLCWACLVPANPSPQRGRSSMWRWPPGTT